MFIYLHSNNLNKLGKNIIAKGQSGIGKSSIFVIGALQVVDTANKQCQVFAVMPTRELAMSTNCMIKQMGQYIDNLSTHAVVACTSIRNDIEKITGTQIITGIPGRALDLITRGVLKLTHLKLFVIDDAELIFSRGFKEQINDIMKYISIDNTQIALFSDTISSKDIKEFTSKYMQNAIYIHQQREELKKQYFVHCQREEYKLQTLRELLRKIRKASDNGKIMIFVNTRRKLKWVMDQNIDGNIIAMHGDLTSIEREITMKKWRSDKNIVLMTTDIVSRGIVAIKDLPKWIVGYDLPPNRENYICRVGKGDKNVINFVCEDQLTLLRDIETFYNAKMEELPIDFFDLVVDPKSQ